MWWMSRQPPDKKQPPDPNPGVGTPWLPYIIWHLSIRMCNLCHFVPQQDSGFPAWQAGASLLLGQDVLGLLHALSGLGSVHVAGGQVVGQQDAAQAWSSALSRQQSRPLPHRQSTAEVERAESVRSFVPAANSTVPKTIRITNETSSLLFIRFSTSIQDHNNLNFPFVTPNRTSNNTRYTTLGNILFGKIQSMP